MNFRESAEALAPVLREHRHWLHRHAELSFEEWNTTKYIIGQLERLGIPYTSFPDYPGVIGHIRGGKAPAEGHVQTVLLRADIDALPIKEASGVDFVSETDGVMHACGHDTHTTNLLGAAELLKAAESELKGNVELLFQSAEEAFTGSHYYLDKGYLKDVDYVFGAHVWPTIASGLIDVTEGNRMASCDNFKIHVKGVSCHGSAPQNGHDAIIAAASIVLNTQTLVSRRNDPRNPMVISVDMVKAGTQFNIVTDRAELEGTMRTYDKAYRAQIKEEFGKVVAATADALGCEAELEYTTTEDPVINCHPAENDIARKAAAKIVGSENVVQTAPGMGSEDFGYIMDHIPGTFIFIGSRDESCDAVWGLHSDKFRINEEILPKGAAVYAQFAADYLEAQQN